MTEPTRIVLTVDVGPAAAVLGAGHRADADWSATWRGLDAMCDAFERVQDVLSTPIGVTWLCRADALVLQQLGSRTHVFETVGACIERFHRSSDELGWMPQVYSGSGPIAYDDIAETHEVLIRNLGTTLRCVRMGDCFHDGRTIEMVSDLGLRVDSSALPGRVKVDRGWRMDWSGTPAHPYHPSVSDYRRPGEPSRDILEVPLTMGALKAPYDEAPLRRYLNPAWRASYFSQALDSCESADNAHGKQIVCVVHPDEVIYQPEHSRHPLSAHSSRALEANIELLHATAEAGGRQAKFVRLGDLAG